MHGMINPLYSLSVHAIPASARVVLHFDWKMEVVEREFVKQKIGSIGGRPAKVYCVQRGCATNCCQNLLWSFTFNLV